MTAAAPFGEDAFTAADADVPANDWVDEAARGPAEFELYLDEATGLYEIRRVQRDQGALVNADATADVDADETAEPNLPEPTPVLEVVVEDAPFAEEPLAGWASLAGSTGPSAFHTPLLWGLTLTGGADFSPLPALDQSRGGSAWRLNAAA